MVIWLAGLSGSGKSTFAKHIFLKLRRKYKNKVLKIDGDEIRYLFKKDLGYSLKDRIKNAERISKLVYFLNKNTDIIKLKCCNNILHYNCYLNYVKTIDDYRCPICRNDECPICFGLGC